MVTDSCMSSTTQLHTLCQQGGFTSSMLSSNDVKLTESASCDADWNCILGVGVDSAGSEKVSPVCSREGISHAGEAAEDVGAVGARTEVVAPQVPFADSVRAVADAAQLVRDGAHAEGNP